MGLDQYLTAKHPQGQNQEVAYWRKANQIHKWFVEHVQHGHDNCDESPVSREQLTDLRDLCKLVLENSKCVPSMVTVCQVMTKHGWKPEREPGFTIDDPTLAMELLPRQSGFFFGSTEYDQFYCKQLESTITQINKALELPTEWTFVYCSSW